MLSGIPSSSPNNSPAVAAGLDYRFTFVCAVATCVVIPAYIVRWHIGPLPTTMLENAILLTAAVFIIESIRSGLRPAWRSPVALPAALFLVVGGISVFVAPDRRAGLGLYRAYIVEPIAFALVLSTVVSTAQRAVAIVMGLAGGASVAGLANALIVLIALRHHDYNVLNTPPVVIYNTANAVALYLVPIIAVSGAIGLFWPDRSIRLLAIGFAAIASVCVLLSFSRGGYLALLAVLLGLALSHPRRWLLLTGGLVAGVLVFQIPAIGTRVRAELDFGDPHNTLVGRFQLWSAAVRMLAHHPIFGAGLAGFATALAPYWNQNHADRFTYPHNIFLNFWTEVGLAGVIVFAWIVVVTAARSWRGWRQRDPQWRAIHLGVLLAVAAVLVHGLVDVPYWKNDLSLEFWILLSLVFAPAASPVAAAPRPRHAATAVR